MSTTVYRMKESIAIYMHYLFQFVIDFNIRINGEFYPISATYIVVIKSIEIIQYQEKREDI